MRLHKESTQKAKQEYAATRYYGEVPNYLRKRKEMEACEREQTLREIQMNKKRPPGTRRVNPDEQKKALDELYGRKEFLQDGIENMSVTLYTNRAQRQADGYVRGLQEVDKALTVFEKERVFVTEKWNQQILFSKGYLSTHT